MPTLCEHEKRKKMQIEMNHWLHLRKWIALAVPIIIVAFLFAGCATRIGPGRVGIKVDLAGTQRGVEDLPIRTGWVFYNFLSSTIVEYPTSIQTAKWTRDLNEGSPTNEEMSFNTKDGLTVYGEAVLGVERHFFVGGRAFVQVPGPFGGLDRGGVFDDSGR